MAFISVKSVLFFVVLAAAAVCAGAQVRGEDWIRVETSNFEVVGDAGEIEIRETAERLERFRSAFGQIMSVRPRRSKTRVVVFKNAAEFRSFKPIRADGTPDDAVNGYFRAGDDVSYIAVAADGSGIGTVYHELAHDLLTADGPRLPPWLDEGLSEYFQTFTIVDANNVRLGTAPRENLRLLRGARLMPWDEFFALDNFTLHQGSDRSRGLFYAQAWAAATYLFERATANTGGNEGKTTTISRILQLLDGTDRGVFEAGVNEIIARSDHAGRLYKIPYNGTEVSPTAGVTPSTANAILGDLLYRIRAADAEAYLNRAIALDPKNAAAFATLGLVRLQERNFAAARESLARAIELDGANHLAHFYYAFLLTQENMDEAGMLSRLDAGTSAKIRTSLRASIDLAPEFAESHKLLAVVEMLPGGDIAAAERALKKALELKPGNAEYEVLLAQVLLRQQRTDEAKRLAEGVVRNSAARRFRADAWEVIAAAAELSKAVSGTLRLETVGYRTPLILQRQDLTDAQVAKIDRERDNYNLNVLVDRAGAGEAEVLGSIENINCSDGRINYSVKTPTGTLRLSGNSFDELRLKVVVPGVRSYALRCESQLAADMGVIVYRPADKRLVAISFVPADFQLMTRAEVLSKRLVIIEGRESGDITQNEKIATEERLAMEREMRETQIRDIDGRLRPAEKGETRLAGVPERLECRGGVIYLTVTTGTEPVTLQAPIADGFEVRSFRPDTGIIENGCGVQLPPVEAVITRRGDRLIAVEFVPKFYKLQ